MDDEFACRCCDCCAQPVLKGGVKINKKLYCNEDHARLNARYSRLCRKAVKKAKRYTTSTKKGEVDYSRADLYLRFKLFPDPFRRQRQVSAAG